MEEIDNNAVAKSSKNFAIGSIVFGKFEILEFIASGGKGSVYKVRDIALNNIFALKVLLVDSKGEKALIRFQSEARTSSKLNHVNIATIYDFGLLDGTPYISMEYVDGKSLKTICESMGHMPLPLFVEVFIQVCEGVQHAHGHGIVHRDLKPDNIVVRTNADGTICAKILDFGVAKQIDDLVGDESRLTPTGGIIGSPLFMSPEQAGGQLTTRESDLYSLGCTMWFCLTGKPPLCGATAIETVMLQQKVAPPPLADAYSDLQLPVELCESIDGLLIKEPSLRPSLADLLATLIAVREAIGVEPIQTEVASVTTSDTKKFLTKSNVKILVSAIVLVLGCVSVFVFVILPKFENVETSSMSYSFEQQPDISKVVKGREYLEKRQKEIRAQKQLLLGYEFTDEQLRSVDMSKVEKIDLTQSSVTDKAFASLVNAPKLLNLRLPSTAVSTLDGIEKLKTLEELDLTDTKVNDDSLDHLAALSKLRTLNLTSTFITNAAFPKLARIPKLEHLILDRTNVSGVGSSSLRRVKKLTWVGMNYSNATIKGIAEIAQLPAIENIELDSCRNLTKDEVKELRGQFPCIKFGRAASRLRKLELEAKDAFDRRNPQKALTIYNSCVNLVKQGYGDNSPRLMPLYLRFADYACVAGEIKLAKEALSKGAILARRTQDNANLLAVMDKQDLIAVNTTSFRNVEPMLIRTNKFAEQIGDQSLLEKRCLEWGNICESRQYFSRALSYFEQWMKIHKPIDEDADREQVACVQIKIGDCHRGLGQNDLAISPYTKGVTVLERTNPQFPPIKSVHALGYGGLAVIYALRNDYVRALEFSDKGNRLVQDPKLLPQVRAVMIHQRIFILKPSKRTAEIAALREEYTRIRKAHPEYPKLEI